MADKKKKTTEETPVAPAEIEEAVVEAVAEDVEMIAAEVAAVEEAIEEDAVEAVAADLEVGAEAVAEAVAEGAITPEKAVAEVVVEAAVAEEAVEEATAEVIAEEIEEAAAVEEALGEAVVEEATAPAPQSGPKIKKRRLPRALRPQKTRPTRTKSAERKPIVRLEKPEHERGRSQERQGTVVSAAMDKTIVVKVEVTKSHRKYKKVVRRSVKFHAHDEANTAKLGDVVRIVETRPLSATKRWRLAEIVKVAE
jgi:small subunit ribosomal protein S17